MKEININDYEQTLKIVNWNYQKAVCASAWNDGRKLYERIVEQCFISPAHRRMFLKYKGEKNEL